MSEQLDLMVIPFQENRAVVLPKTIVEYVLPYARPLPSSYSHYALVGSIIYQNEKVPILDLSLVYNQGQVAELSSGGQRRLVIVPCFNPHREFSSYALITDDAPRLFHTSDTSIKETDDEVEPPFYSYIELAELPNNKLLVIDMQQLESMVFDSEENPQETTEETAE